MKERNIWEEKSVSECSAKTGKAPVSVRWVDTSKGGSSNYLVRNEFARETHTGFQNQL